ncbi:MAG: electron transfer flavoprotein subunit beta/FixA family protein [Bacteroidales bacterium]|nr:electron transfer flavoprotein subunit beta/FixA family protein [Bacteroidales bacterium]
MKILICISNVPDTTTKIRFVNDNTAFDTNGVQWIINPWDELALTRALELKEASDGVIEKVSVVSVGPQGAEPTLRKALAIGADDAIRVNAVPTDAYGVAFQIAEAVKDMGYDMIITGIESSDYNGAAVGGMLAEFLGIPSVSSVSSIGIENGEVSLKREIDGGSEVIGTQIPFVAIIQKGVAIEPRIPSMRGIMMARKKPLNVLEPATVDTMTEFVSYDLPPSKAACKIVDPENMKELVNLLHTEAKVI